jgi:predicted DNA-binding transcriptional regulator YafY
LANSKHAHVRYNLIDYCLKYKSFTFNQLLEYINDKISELYPGESIAARTLRDDIKLFRDPIHGFGAPLPKKSRVLQYSDSNFSIAKRPLLPFENYLIEASQQLLQRFENHPKYDKLAEALIKFQDEENYDDNHQVLFYDQNEEYKGIKHLKPLYLAIQKKQVLLIKYKGFQDTSVKIFEFHPHILKQYNRRWFVFGLNSFHGNSKWSIPLDERLVDIKILENTDYVASDNDWDRFFRTMIGVVRPNGSEIVNVVLRFYNGREKYFKTKPFHPDWDMPFEEDKQDHVYFETIINKELIQQILSYGKDIEVLEPEELKLALRNHANTMQEFYSK